MKAELNLPGFEVSLKKKKSNFRIFDEGKFSLLMVLIKKEALSVREFEQKLKSVFSPKMADVLCVSSGTGN